MKHDASLSGKIIPFRCPGGDSPGDYLLARSKIILKTSLYRPIANAYGIATLDAVRVREGEADVRFGVELRWDHPGQALLCGLLTPDHAMGVAISVDPGSGAIVDAMHGAGPLGYLKGTPVLPGRPLLFEIRMQRFGKNCICTVSAGAEVFSYPAFLAEGEEVFNAVVGSDVGSGSTVHYRRARLTLQTLEGIKVA